MSNKSTAKTSAKVVHLFLMITLRGARRENLLTSQNYKIITPHGLIFNEEEKFVYSVDVFNDLQCRKYSTPDPLSRRV